MELARALALTTIAFSRDAVVQELADRQRAIAETIWPPSPLAGYGLHASLGAYLVARVAVTWAPSGPTGLRHEPLDQQGLLMQLEEQGVEPALAARVIGDFRRVDRGFYADPSGLDTSRIAGLAEGSLSRGERSRALSQVAYSSRCLGRLASAVSVLSSVRAVLPVLPPESLGGEFAAAMVALTVGRPERALALAGLRSESLSLRTLAELADAIMRLGRGEMPSLDRDGPMLWPPEEEEKKPAHASADGGESEDDVLEIVEEKVRRPPPPPRDDDDEEMTIVGVRVRPARWWTSQDAPTDVGDGEIAEWVRVQEGGYGIVAKKLALLGLRVEPPRRTGVSNRVPPDERMVRRALASENGESPNDALFPGVRGALRAIARAAEGKSPSEEAVKHAGDLGWVVRRARALSLIVKGELEGAIESVSQLPADASPEGQWAKDRLSRFAGRKVAGVEPREARPAAAALASDLLNQLGRTIAGTVTSRVRMERVQ
jgi:hypothetical protein